MPAASKKSSTVLNYTDLVTKAVSSLKDKEGSSVQKIVKFVSSNNKGANATHVKAEIQRLVDQGKLVRSKNAYKLAPAQPANASKAAKSGSSTSTAAATVAAPSPKNAKAKAPAKAPAKAAPKAKKASAARKAPAKKPTKAKVQKKKVVKSNRLANVPAPKPEASKAPATVIVTSLAPPAKPAKVVKPAKAKQAKLKSPSFGSGGVTKSAAETVV